MLIKIFFRKPQLFLYMLLVFTVGCAVPDKQPLPTATSSPATPVPTEEIVKPNIIHHPRPKLSVSWDEFPYTDCIEHNSLRYCMSWPSSNDSRDLFVCSGNVQNNYDAQIRDMLFGGLSPNYPIAVCHSDGHNAIDTYLYENFSGGEGLYSYVHYMIYDGEQYQIIASRDDMKRVFAPIESPEEAFSYALATTDLDAYYDGIYGHVRPSRYRYFVTEFEDTHVVEVDGGYTINLYSTSGGGCNLVEVIELNLHIATNGDIQRLSRRKIYEHIDIGPCE